MESSGCAGLLPPLQHNWCCQQLLLRLLRACLLSADGSAAPLPWSRMKRSLAASSQPKPLLPWPTALGLSPSRFLSQRIKRPRLAGFSDAALFIPGWTHTSNLFSKFSAALARQGSIWSVHLCCLQLWRSREVTTNLGKGEPKIWISPPWATTRSAVNMYDPNHWLLGFFWVFFWLFRKIPGIYISRVYQGT